MKESLEPASKLLVEDAQHDTQARVDLLGCQGRMDVANVICLYNYERPGGFDACGPQDGFLAVVTLDDGSALAPGAGSEAVTLIGYDNHVLAEPAQLLKRAQAESVEAAEDNVGGFGLHDWLLLGSIKRKT